MKRNSTAKIAATLLVSTGILSGTSAYASCPPDCPDEIVVTGEKWDPYQFGFWVMNIFYSGSASGGGGGGNGTFLRQAAFLDDINPDDVPYVVPQRHRIDVDDNGTADVTFSANFVVYGIDEDTDGVPDVWENLVGTYRAWPF